MPNVSFKAPTEYETELADIERRRAYARALQEQGMQPMDTQMAGGWAIPRSPMEMLGKTAQQLAGAYGQKRATEESRGVAKKYQEDMNRTFAEALRAGTGTPARPQQMGADDLAMIADQGGEAAPMIEGAAPDRAKMAQILMQHPGTQQIGMQQLTADMQRQALVAALRGGQGPQAGPQGAPTAPDMSAPQPGPGMAPPPAGSRPQAQLGGPAGGIPMEVWLQADPSGKSYMAQFAKDQTEGAKLGMDRAKLDQTIAEFNGLSAYQRAQLANQGISSAIDLARARDQGLSVQLPTQGTPQGAPAQQPATQGMSPNMQIPPQVQAQRDAEAAAIQGREATGAGVPTASVVPGSVAGAVRPAPPTPGMALSPAQQRELAMADVKRGREKAADLPQATLQVKTQLGDISRLRNLADEILRSPALERSVGITGALPSVPGSEASNVDSLIESMAAQISGYKLQAMRGASKTGGAVGQVTEREWPRLENMIIALKTKMSPEKYREKLGELILEMDKTEKSITDAFQQEYGSKIPTERRREDKPVIYAVNPKTKERIMSIDGGASWEPAR